MLRAPRCAAGCAGRPSNHRGERSLLQTNGTCAAQVTVRLEAQFLCKAVIWTRPLHNLACLHHEKSRLTLPRAAQITSTPHVECMFV